MYLIAHKSHIFPSSYYCTNLLHFYGTAVTQVLSSTETSCNLFYREKGKKKRLITGKAITGATVNAKDGGKGCVVIQVKT